MLIKANSDFGQIAHGVNSDFETRGRNWCRLRAFFAAFLVLLVWGIGVFFRSYALFPEGAGRTEVYRPIVEQHLKGILRDRIRGELLEGDERGFAPKDLDERVEQLVREAIDSDTRGFKFAVDELLLKMPRKASGARSKRHYLLEADPYYYFGLTKRIADTGELGFHLNRGKYYDPLRLYPKGVWMPPTLHPYAGYFFYRLLNFIKPLPLMEALCFFPLAVLGAVVLSYYNLVRRMKLGLWAFALSALVLVLSPIFLQRSSFGWYDTDPYNILFPCLILTCFIASFQAPPKAAVRHGLFAGVLTAFYACFWMGWPLLFFLVGGIALINIFVPGNSDDLELQLKMRKFFAAYAFSTLLAAVFFLTPQGLIEIVMTGLKSIRMFSSSQNHSWPNVFVTVGEANPISLLKLVFLIGHPVSVGIAILGVYLAFRRNPKTDWFGRLAWTWGLISIPLVILALRTERFALLLVLPLAVFCAFAVELAPGASAALFRRLRILGDEIRAFRAVSSTLMAVILLPIPLFVSHMLASRQEPMMNDAWYEAMTRIRKETPGDSVIYSWWPPGYFITSLAERRVIADGGTQHLPATYWLARFFMAKSEAEGLGILRLLRSGGNDAVNYLLQRGWSLPECFDFLNHLFLMEDSEIEAAALNRLGPEASLVFMRLFAGSPSGGKDYVLIYDEMVKTHISISLIAGWNFRKAQEAGVLEGAWMKGLLPGVRRSDYLKQMMRLSEGIYKQFPEAPVTAAHGQTAVFENGITVDFSSKTAFFKSPKSELKGRPESLFLIEQGKLREYIQRGEVLNISVIVYKKEDSLFSILADKEMIRSLLFQLYYLRGQTLSRFIPVIETFDLHKGTQIQVFHVRDGEESKKARYRKESL